MCIVLYFFFGIYFLFFYLVWALLEPTYGRELGGNKIWLVGKERLYGV